MDTPSAEGDADTPGPCAFVLGGGGALGACEVGMLRALLEAGIAPDLVVGTSVGAVNGAVVAASPTMGAVAGLGDLWGRAGVFSGSVIGRMSRAARSRTYLYSAEPLRRLLEANLPAGICRIEELPVRFQCVAASIERAAEHWFTRGPLVDAVLASCAVPGLFPPAQLDGEHFLDGGLANSIPVGRAVALGARRVFVLQVGRIEEPLAVPRLPWEVASVAFEIARRHRFARDMEDLPDGAEVHLLPTGGTLGRAGPVGQLRYRDFELSALRIDRAYQASAAYLADRGLAR
ncbi:patatin-like phospholipase family protein [Streptacidiphilus jiangxiensis]|uniref:patatin-like phospholipase family protein n=1 Tax=Streptacidiphilus jiangxiensis TaxID=235985 RepID=UPI000A8BB31C|nr:patatin-like phospholipase family protein [Streptacidiphilus jiangxiensis]